MATASPSSARATTITARRWGDGRRLHLSSDDRLPTAGPAGSTARSAHRPLPAIAPPRPAALSETFAGFGDFLLIIFAVVAAALLMLIVGLMRKMKIVKVPKAGQPGSPEKPTRAHHGPMSIVDLDSGKEVMTPEQRRANRQHAQLQNAAITSRLNALKRSVDAQPKTAWGDDAVKSKSSPFGLRGPPAPPAERRSPMGAKAAARERLAAGNAGVLPRRG